MNVFFKSRFLRLFCTTLTLFLTSHLISQIDSTESLKHTKQKVVLNSGIIAGWTGSQTALYKVWYADYNSGKFHFFNDSREWLYMDKLGHLFTNYQLTKTLYHSYLVSYPEKSALFRSTAVSLGYQTTLEIMDGYSSGWGFSWTDMLANSLGASLFCIQHELFGHQLIKPKFSFSPSNLAQYRPNLLGHSFVQQLFKDYNGQTYWYSLHPMINSPKSNWIPLWLNISLGYSISNKLDAHNNTYQTSDGQTWFASTEFLCALDIDLEKIPVKNKYIRGLFRAVNAIKIPLPTVGFSTGKLHFYPVYF